MGRNPGRNPGRNLRFALAQMAHFHDRERSPIDQAQSLISGIPGGN